MDVELCRICAKEDDNFVHIFKSECLKTKLETCLPIIVTEHYQLPDTICTDCLETVDKYYIFIKSCLENIEVLETQYNVIESCLLSKRKVDRCISVDPCDLLLVNSTYTAELDINDPLTESPTIVPNLAAAAALGSLVDYECSSTDSEPDNDEDTNDIDEQTATKPVIVKQEPDDSGENKVTVVNRTNVHGKDIIDEIVQRKHLKRKNNEPRSSSNGSVAKIPRLETKSLSAATESSSRRKNKQPKKVEYHLSTRLDECSDDTTAPAVSASVGNVTNFFANDILPNLPADISVTREIDGEIQRPLVAPADGTSHTCLLCEQRLNGLLALATHMYETHGIDLAQVYTQTNNHSPLPVPLPPLPMLTPAPVPQQTVCNKNRKIPELVKISDVLGTRINKQKSAEPKANTNAVSVYTDDPLPPVLEPQLQDRTQQSLLRSNISSGHVVNSSQYTCTECPDTTVTFASFKEYTTHRRAHHQIFHCDLCPKFYGRNSHLWKHVNRVHKGHPSITCQQCHKTSASEYHLAQHFNKMHSAKPQHSHSHFTTSRHLSTSTVKIKVEPNNSRYANNSPANVDEQNEEDEITGGAADDEDDLLNQKFQGFDFKSVRQSFLRQELMMNKRHKYVSILKKKNSNAERDTSIASTVGSKRAAGKNSNTSSVTITTSTMPNPNAPKEIDSSSDLYTNIITNYTPPSNEGPYKCPKCFKGFHKKNLLKKHKKNCRPRLQKDLLTRCKTCSRIFKDRQSLAKHLVNYHSEYTCEICGVAVQSKCEIVSHIRFTHPGSPDLQCHCGQILRSRADLARHKADHRDSHVCQFCGDALPTKIKLKMHILSLHRKILSLSCGICLKLFETQHILKEHVRLVHGDQLQPLTSCTVCGKNYGSKWKTYDHLNKSHGRIFKACKACLEVFETERELQTHFDKEHLNNAGAGSKHSNQQQHMQLVMGKQDEGTPLHSANVTDNEDNDEEDDEGVEEDVEMPAVDEQEPEMKQKSVDCKQQSLLQNGYYRKQQGSAAAPAISVQENKFSLLEKRLLGKKVPDEEATASKNSGTVTAKNNNNTTNNNKRVNTTKNPSVAQDIAESPPLDKNGTISFETCSTSAGGIGTGDILQNSSKRTVYVNSNDPSLCEICLKVWPAKKHLWQHYIRCHKQVAATVCGICLKTNPSYSSLQTHLRDTHPHLLHGCGFGSNFICKICGRYHNASSKLKLHMAIHVGFTESALLVVDSNSNSNASSSSNMNNNTARSTTSTAQNIAMSDRSKHKQQQQQQQLLGKHQVQQQQHTATDNSDNEEDGEEIIDEDVEEYDEEQEEYEHDNEGTLNNNNNNNQSGSDENEADDTEEQGGMIQNIVIIKHEMPDHPDYESLIEEVEASSDDDEEDEGTSQVAKKNDGKYVIRKQEQLDGEEAKKRAMSSSPENVPTTDNDDDPEEESDDDDEEVLTENDLEQEMLKNMIGESMAVVHVKRENNALDNDDDDDDEDEEEEGIDLDRSDTEYVEDVDVKMEVCSSPDEDEEDGEEIDEEDDDDDDEEWMNSDQQQQQADEDEEQLLLEQEQEQQRLFDHRPDELDDAIRSISYEECDSDDNVNGTSAGLYSDQLSTASGLTESELETAVGSIL